MFEIKGFYYCGLQWINKFYSPNDEDKLKQKQQNEVELLINQLRDSLKQKRLNYISQHKEIKLIEKSKKENTNAPTYYINKKWYDEYKSYIENQHNKLPSSEEIPSFPREIDNYELLSGKDMLDNTQYILNKDETNYVEICENEWNFLKEQFTCTNEIKVNPQQNISSIYKILVIEPQNREEAGLYSFEPKYLILNHNETLYSYFKNKYQTYKIKIYYYNYQLSIQKRKEFLFELIFFVSLTKEKNFNICENILYEIDETNDFIEKEVNWLGQIFFIDINNYIQIQTPDKCFYCSSKLDYGSINCEECLIMKQTTLFCSETCIQHHQYIYHNQLFKYQTFQYNTNYLIKQTFPDKEGGLIGLQNLTNTCFMNSSLQCLFQCKEFLNYLFLKQYEKEPLNSKEELTITNKFVNLAKQIWSNNHIQETFNISNFSYSKSIVPKELKDAINFKLNKYNDYSQHDSPEFLLDFLDLIAQELNRSKSSYYNIQKTSLTVNQPMLGYGSHLNSQNSIVEDLFHGQFRHKFICQSKTCGQIQNTFEDFLFLDLAFPSETKDYLTFKFFKLGKYIFEIKEFQSRGDIIYVSDFKKNYSTNDFCFEMYLLTYSGEGDVTLRMITDSEKISDLKKLKYKSEVVLYETISSSDNTQLLFIYPFSAHNQLQQINESDSKTFQGFELGKTSRMFYPVRIQINTNGFIKEVLRNFFKDNLNIHYNGLCHDLELYEKKSFQKNYFVFITRTKEMLVKSEEVKLCNLKSKKLYLNLSNYYYQNPVYIYQSVNSKNNSRSSNGPLNLYDMLELNKNPKSTILCKKCKSNTVMKSTISKMPFYLCFHLKRFKYNFENNHFEKIQTVVDYPEQLNINSFIDQEENFSFEVGTSSQECEYEIFAMNRHLGTLNSGHYMAYAKVRGNWYCFNDYNVSPVDNYKNLSPLILFYKRMIFIFIFHI